MMYQASITREQQDEALVATYTSFYTPPARSIRDMAGTLKSAAGRQTAAFRLAYAMNVA
ncbi:hypothetical protein AMATHDRAFT_60719 [Amanita thiersii Skay4041]|uniref:Uncharacterized protein n=1 Tax=Amanita thiersii Skay4041 TaxID=703135 RepID=A0A2A9NSF8_9AGAR|nr:hypothetical protein AMATHDRAFT_60719 [Amanita thiersii Skay4041]